MITDVQFQSMGVAVGQVATIKAPLSGEGVPQYSQGANKKKTTNKRGCLASKVNIIAVSVDGSLSNRNEHIDCLLVIEQ